GDPMKQLLRFAALLFGVVAMSAQAQNLSIATGGTGGVYYPLGGGMAAVLSKYVDGMQATAEVTGGSVANLQLIGTGKPYIGLSMNDAALDALQGQGKFKGRAVPVRTLAEIGRASCRDRESIPVDAVICTRERSNTYDERATERDI